jgi:hypothetical protein
LTHVLNFSLSLNNATSYTLFPLLMVSCLENHQRYNVSLHALGRHGVVQSRIATCSAGNIRIQKSIVWRVEFQKRLMKIGVTVRGYWNRKLQSLCEMALSWLLSTTRLGLITIPRGSEWADISPTSSAGEQDRWRHPHS